VLLAFGFKLLSNKVNIMSLSKLRQHISRCRFCSEDDLIHQFLADSELDMPTRQRSLDHASEMVGLIRADSQPGLMEQFLAEYGLSTKEGIALMCLAEAYLRTPDALSLDALIRDKIGPGNWKSHLGMAGSFLVNASTWGLLLTGRMYQDRSTDDQPVVSVMLQLIGRLGESLVQKAITQAMIILGKQFVLGRNIDEALSESKKGKNSHYRYSFDMLGEAALTADDADKYFQAYTDAITAIAEQANATEVHNNPGISVKLSALHPRYEHSQHDRVMAELLPRLKTLAAQACAANIGFTIDAEEADRLELSLDLIEAVICDSELARWQGFGVVVQAYSKQAPVVIDWLTQLARTHNRRMTVRLVKGAYWDYEIKQAQMLGLENYPVYTRKASTDISYLNCAQRLLKATDVIYPQFATHNAHTACAILEMKPKPNTFEFQRLHGMGEVMHRLLIERNHVSCRIYAPVGVHKDLLAYLVRRLLENGANSSFVNKLLDKNTPIDQLITDPMSIMESLNVAANPLIPLPTQLFGTSRLNSSGLNLNLHLHAQSLDQALTQYRSTSWEARSSIAGPISKSANTAALPVYSPSKHTRQIGTAIDAEPQLIQQALENSQASFNDWSNRSVTERAAILDQIAELYQQHSPELIAIACLEAGKTRMDGILEVREAIDFCRYYAVQARKHLGDSMANKVKGIGPVVCISPWNFPLAIFTGQVAAALVCGNTVLAKPAEQTPLIATRAVDLMYQAGVPKDVLQLILGKGSVVGHMLTSSPLIKGVWFTGSTVTAAHIDQNLAKHADPDCRLIAETGGLNTMIVDSTSLLEQAVSDIVASAFQSAGQRCSALRVLCVQEEVEEDLLKMLAGAAHELVIGEPWNENTDIGPVIDQQAKTRITDHCEQMIKQGRLLFKVPLPESLNDGYFVSPIAFRLNSLDELKQEIFGPVLHVFSFKGKELDALVEKINKSGFGLTMGIHSRISKRVDQICQAAKVGNIYVNRNQIGAVVGVQPFGGEGLSGTGPKAGGPHYLRRFYQSYITTSQALTKTDIKSDERKIKGLTNEGIAQQLEAASTGLMRQVIWNGLHRQRLMLINSVINHLPATLAELARSACHMDADLSFLPLTLPGPTGEENILTVHGRGMVLCLGGGEALVKSMIYQVFRSLMTGNLVKISSNSEGQTAQEIIKAFSKAHLKNLLVIETSGSMEKQLSDPDIVLVMFDGSKDLRTGYRQVLAARQGARIALVSSNTSNEMLTIERVVSTDTTASGGNATLLALGDD
jgi:RHH-type proline utilization regulon transcriptional repressor/proline dehydrogenase/delta 1-pyrroline-5-carboxylate dehydrogenase